MKTIQIIVILFLIPFYGTGQQRFAKLIPDSLRDFTIYGMSMYNDSLFLYGNAFVDSSGFLYKGVKTFAFNKYNINTNFKVKQIKADSLYTVQSSTFNAVIINNKFIFGCDGIKIVNDSVYRWHPFWAIDNRDSLEIGIQFYQNTPLSGATHIKKITDNKYFVSYQTITNNTGITCTSCLTIAVLDSNLNQQWVNNTLSGELGKACFVNQLLQFDDSTYYGILQEVSGDGSDEFPNFPYLIKLNNQGELIQRIPIYHQFEVYKDYFSVINIEKTADNNILLLYSCPQTQYIFNGQYEVGGKDSASYVIAKIDNAGNLLWRKNYSKFINRFFATEDTLFDDYQVYFNAHKKTSDGGIVMCGKDAVTASIFKVDANGNPLWFRRFHPVFGNLPFTHSNSDTVFSDMIIIGVEEAEESSIYISGYISYIVPGLPYVYQNGFYMRLDKYGCLNEGCQLTDGIQKIVVKSEILLYPNPTTSELNIVTGGVFDAGKPINISISNYTGQVVFSQTYNTTYATINVEHFANGLYLVTLQQQGKESVKRKVVVVH